jgi:hypothetical protein
MVEEQCEALRGGRSSRNAARLRMRCRQLPRLSVGRVGGCRSALADGEAAFRERPLSSGCRPSAPASKLTLSGMKPSLVAAREVFRLLERLDWITSKATPENETISRWFAPYHRRVQSAARQVAQTPGCCRNKRPSPVCRGAFRLQRAHQTTRHTR